uniref:Cytochrome P450 3201B2 n=1 Tax=Chamberlinius hualienensis TaxID=1551368 RepID=A0A1J1E1N0_9MYRI|nr:cytochrome P450 3201B2 [Chamberlinius hualienensis]
MLGEYLKLWTILATLVVIWLLTSMWKWIKVGRYLPPGPWGLPVVGYLPWINSLAFLTFEELRKKYGSIFSVNLGPTTAVVLADWKAIKATLVDKSMIFSGRPYHHTFETATKRCTVSFNDGKVWHDQRRLTIKCLRKVGVGRTKMEEIVSHSIDNIIDHLKTKNNQMVSLEDVLFKNVMSILWKMVANKTFADGDKECDEFEKMVTQIMISIRSNNPINFMPWLRFIPPNGFGHWDFVALNNKIYEFLNKQINIHLSNWKEGLEDDFIDHYIAAIKEHEKQTLGEEKHLNTKRLTGTLWDLFVAGTDTTVTTALWGFLYICLWPEVQKKAQKELDEVIGRERLPCLSDFQSGKLPYVDAMIMEVHRFASIVPLSLVHCPLDTVEIFGYKIPKRTPCIQSIYNVHFDPELWVEPKTFNPERFINDKNEAKSPPYLMPFSIGPRICIGESLATQELRLLFGSLLHKFNFSIPNKQNISIVPQVSLVVKPKPYKLLVQLR